ncbi:MAG TPA: pantoate--beta-alanine ligase, partial [Candidatus Tenderia electrophaga]|nr:pantoate--beta-alanine ligase [Candidatus Tenderia electrophaga]
MQTVHTITGLRQQIGAWRQQGETVAFVPTMGNLHAGHLALVAQARQHADRVVVSIFVNPMQFGADEDLDAYPRTLAADSAKLEPEVDLLFAPSAAEIYPQGHGVSSQIDVPGVSEGLCGEFRPGHFTGVATVVAKLFNMIQPDYALFGNKDYQQLQVIRRMVADLCFPVKVIAVPTAREADGLALSSRNVYLSSVERELAPRLYQALQKVAQALLQGRRDYAVMEQEGLDVLEEAGFVPEYFSIRQAGSLKPAQPGMTELVVLTAAKLGKTRLIDNLA